MGKVDIGRVRSLSIKCLSEVAWHDNARMRQDVKESGGLQVDQFDVRWTPENAAGVSALIETVDGGGRPRKILMDVGWDVAYMDEVFRREGIDGMLSRGEIDFLYVTHEHVDHFWGLPAALKYRADVKILSPAGFSEKSRELLAKSGHTGRVVELGPESAHVLFPGCASATFGGLDQLPTVVTGNSGSTFTATPAARRTARRQRPRSADRTRWSGRAATPSALRDPSFPGALDSRIASRTARRASAAPRPRRGPGGL